MARRPLLHALLSFLVVAVASTLPAEDLPLVGGVERQPLVDQARRIADSLAYLGEPLSKEEQAALSGATKNLKPEESIAAIQKVLDSRCLAGVNINPESRVKVARGPAKAELAEQGWRVFLVKVHNEGGVTAALRATSPNAEPLHKRSTSSP